MELYQELQKNFTEIEESFTRESLEKFMGIPYEDLSFCHFGLGLWVRNHLLTEESRLRRLFMDGGVCELDDMSDLVIKSFYLYIKMKNRPNQP